MVLKLNNIGAFFAKKGNEVFIVAYMKTNYIMKKPQFAKRREFHVPNMLFTAIFDDKGRDYIADRPISIADFNKLMTEDFKEYYDFSKYTSPEQLHAAMKATGLKGKYTPAWFAERSQFIHGQMAHM